MLGFDGEVYLESDDRSSMHTYADLYKRQTFIIGTSVYHGFDHLMDKKYIGYINN